MATELRIDPRGQAFARADHLPLIGGDQVPAASGKTFETYDPATGEPQGTFAEGDSEDIDRGRVIHRIGDLIVETPDNGKPPRDSSPIPK